MAHSRALPEHKSGNIESARHVTAPRGFRFCGGCRIRFWNPFAIQASEVLSKAAYTVLRWDDLDTPADRDVLCPLHSGVQESDKASEGWLIK